MGPSERLTLILKELNLDGRRMAEALGVSGASISDWKSGKIPIKKPTALAMQTVFGVAWQWLLYGEGPKWASTDQVLTENPVATVEHLRNIGKCGPGGEIPEVGPDAPCSYFERRLLREMLFECGSGSIEDLYIIDNIGDSMRPTIHPGDQVMINTALALRVKPKRGGLYLTRMTRTSSDLRIRRVRLEPHGWLHLYSDTPGFVPVEIKIDDVPLQSLLIGRVCWISRNLINDENPERNW